MIDTRAPVEFLRGTFEHATNLPLMTDEERHLVGTRYKELGQEAAIALGRELVTPALQAQRVAKWKAYAESHPEGYLYCFRGGLRSRITQQWLADAGVEYPFIQGGYKAMRRFLIERLESDSRRARVVLISGRTGTGKTILLNRIQRSIDLEGLANHRGSSFGPMAEPQPSPINYENSVAVALLKLMELDASSEIFVEGEGKQVGSLSVPPPLWQTMAQSPTLILEATMARRVEVGIADYVVDLLQRIQHGLPGAEGFVQFAERHRHSLYKIRKRLGSEHYQHASALLDTALKEHQHRESTEAYAPFIELLLTRYYDPMYDYQLAQRNATILATGDEAALTAWLARKGVAFK